MGKMFANLKTDGVEKQEDRLGGGYEPFESGVYDGVIKLAYVGQAESGAQSVTLNIDIGGKEYRETVYVTNKKGENFFVDKQDSKKKTLLPGYSLIDDISLFCTEQPLSEQETEPKIVKLYNYDEKKELNTEVPMLVDFIGKPIKLAIQKVTEFKAVKQGDAYVDTAETRDTNNIEKVFHPETGRTVNEYLHGVMTDDFHQAWKKKNTGVTRDKTRGKTPVAGAAGTGSPFGAAGGAAKAANIFGKKA